MSKKKRKAPVPYCTPRAAGPGWRLQILDPETGRKLSPREIDPEQPAFYETDDDVRAAYTYLHEILKLRLERGAMLRGFWQDWTDPDHWQWGTHATGRKMQSLATQRSHAKGFVEFFDRDLTIASITRLDVEAWLKTRPAKSSITVLDQMFRAAVEAKLRRDNPFEHAGKMERKAAYRRRDEREKLGDNAAPSPAQIATLLDELGNPVRYPYGLYAWFLTATEVGMRSGELDAMKREYLDLSDPSAPTYRICEQYHAGGKVGFTTPKYNSIRTIALPATLVPVLERCAWEAEHRFGGSPFLFHTSRGQHWRNPARAYYWNDDEKNVRGGRPGLRRLVGDVSMYCATRAYFATQAVLEHSDKIPQIAKHYGHKDNGRVLLQFYARLTDEHGREGMAEIFNSRSNVVRLSDRRAA